MLKDIPQFYGAVTVSDRGQIVIPTRARRDLNISVGEKMLVLGGPEGGIVLIRASLVGQMLSRWTDVLQQLEENIPHDKGELDEGKA